MWIFKQLKQISVKKEIIDNGYECWYLCISDTKQLCEYWKKKVLPRYKKGENEIKLVKHTGKLGHYTEYEAWLIDVLTQVGIDGLNEMEISARLKDGVLKTQIKTILEYGAIYINSSGGYMMIDPNYSDYQVCEIIEKDILEFPVNNYRIIKWPNGNHYYIKNNNDDIVVNGVQKWNTRKEAQEIIRGMTQ